MLTNGAVEMSRIARRRGAAKPASPVSSAPRVLTVRDLADYLRVHQSTIYKLLKKGGLPGFKVGGDWRFHIDAIEQWREKQERN
ncbi:MAG: helix-turn-helix domain-containing protein [Candidatus Binataceae bacterium]